MTARTPRARKCAASSLTASCLAALLAAGPINSWAQLEEVIVTAEKREQDLQDVPVSIAVLGVDDIERLGISEISDLNTLVPNLQMAPFADGNSAVRLFMRGVGIVDVQLTQDPAVALYRDGIYIGRSAGLSTDVAELERIEVLRGPQGTLNGRNATGGAINLISSRPDLDDLAFRQTVSAGSDDYWQSYTRLNLPLIESKLAAKAAYMTSQRDGWLQNTGEGPDFWDEDREAAMIDLRWQPNSRVTVDYSYDYSNSKDVPYTFQAAIVSDPAAISNPELLPISDEREDRIEQVQRPLASDIDVSGHTLIAEWDMGPFVLKSLTGYRELDQQVYLDFSAGYPLQTVFASFGNEQQDQFSQEFQLLGSTLENRLQYVAGLYYFEEDGDADSTGTAFGTPNLQGSRSSANNESIAAYGQLTWVPQFMDERWELTAGGRYTEDKRKASLVNLFAQNPTSDRKGDDDWSKFTPSFSALYALSDNTNLYGRIATAFKSGGFNIRSPDSSDFSQGFDEENLVSYELGGKSELWDRRLRINAAVFYSDYDDIQLNVTVPGSLDPSQTDVFNAGEATIKGLELDITAMLTEGLTLTAQYGYLDAEYDDIQDPFLGDVTDDFQFSNAPEHSASVGLEHWQNLTIGELGLSANYSWQDDVIYNRRVADEALSKGEDYGLLSARATLRDVALGIGGGTVKIAVWGKNLLDEENQIDALSTFQGLHADRLVVYGWPRHYGVDVTFDF